VLPAGTAHVPAELSDPDRAGDPANSPDLMQWLDKLVSVGARIGTSSDRRQGQLLQWRPDLQISPARGNVDTRLRKLDSADWDALVLAAAGLRRLGLSHRITALFPPLCIVPAAGQGVLALELRNDDTRTQDLIGALDHAPTRLSVTAERSFVRCAGGGCSVPLGASARIAGANLELWFRAVAPGGSQTPAPIEHIQSAPMPENPYGDMAWAGELGEKAAARFLEMGGKAFLP
jgi:hydroxymethylbilane synthase